MSLIHLVTEPELVAGLGASHYAPSRFAEDGFVHRCAEPASALAGRDPSAVRRFVASRRAELARRVVREVETRLRTGRKSRAPARETSR